VGRRGISVENALYRRRRQKGWRTLIGERHTKKRGDQYRKERRD